MPRIERRYDQGIAQTRDPSDLSDGEMVEATGVQYRPRDGRAHKRGGRSEFGSTTSPYTPGATPHKGLHLITFDDAVQPGTVSDEEWLLLHKSDGTLQVAPTAGGEDFSGANVNPSNGGTPSGSLKSVAHYNDRHYLAFGGTSQMNKVIRPDTDNNQIDVYDMGLAGPQDPLTLTAASSSLQDRPTAVISGSWSSQASAYDSSDTSYAYKTLSSVATNAIVFGTFGSNTGSNRVVTVSYGISGAPPQNPGGGGSPGYSVKLKIEVSEDSGSNYTTILDKTTSSPVSQTEVQTAYTDSTNTNLCYVRVTFKYISGTSTATARIHDIRITDGSATSFTTNTDNGLYYGITEYDESEGVESQMGPTENITLSGDNGVTVTLPGSAQNSRATHYRVYRGFDGGTVNAMGLLAEVDVSESSYLDDFGTYGLDELPPTPHALLRLQSDIEESPLYYPRDSQPPVMRVLVAFDGGLVGLTDTNPRALHYSIRGLPESWPEIYVVDDFALSERDELLNCGEVDARLVLAAKGAMLRIGALPRLIDGRFVQGDLTRKIAGAPGCVGQRAFCVASLQGRSHAFWVSESYGVLATDGFTWSYASDDLDWSAFRGFDKSGWVLFYDQSIPGLILAYSSTSGGNNDRFFIGHVHPSHVKNGGPKWTGPHYGRIADITGGSVDGAFKTWTMHDVVALEDDRATGADFSKALDGSATTHRLRIIGPKRYQGDRAWAVTGAALRHSDFGAGETASVEYTVGRDTAANTSTRTVTVSLAGEERTLFDIARGGEHHQEKITHDGTGLGAIVSLQLQAMGQGKETDVA